MFERFRQHIETNHLCNPQDHILLAVSGGVDSMVMLHLFQTLKYAVSVAHVNFQLRGADSDADEAFVKEYCAHQGIPFHSTRTNTNNYAMEHGLSIQMAARELRYAWFKKIMNEQGDTLLATAHHFNDSLETVLLNWAHGAGVESFAGIALKRDNIIRPLLFATREEVLAYAKQESIAWREDSSNRTDDYQRNFIRHQVIPKLKEINPSLEATLLKRAHRLQHELDFYHASAKAWQKEHVIHEGTTTKITRQSIQTAAHPALMLWHALKEFGFSYEQCDATVLAAQGQSGKQFLAGNYKLTIDRDYLLLTLQQTIWTETTIERGETTAQLGPWQLQLSLKERVVEPTVLKNSATLDAAKLQFPLTWRKWRAGDLFHPLGMTHRKKLSDFLIDSKIPVGEKDSVTVLESAGEIVWVAGYRIDDRFKITDRTTEVLFVVVGPRSTVG